MIYIIVPYRNREEHLRIFLEKVPLYLIKNNIDYNIIFSEQKDENLFNRGKLLNCAFNFIEDILTDDDIVCFHDIDVIPNDDYFKFDYKSYIKNTVRYQYGVYDWLTCMFMCDKNTFKKVNGYPNNYIGWGREDDCLNYRFQSLSIKFDKSNFIERKQNLELSHKYDCDVNYTWNHNNDLLEKEKNNKNSYLENGLSNLEYKIENIDIITDKIKKIEINIC